MGTPAFSGNAEETFVVTVLGAREEANVTKSLDPAQINMDGGATKHMTPCFDLENKVVNKVAVVVGTSRGCILHTKGINVWGISYSPTYYWCLASCIL